MAKATKKSSIIFYNIDAASLEGSPKLNLKKNKPNKR